MLEVLSTLRDRAGAWFHAHAAKLHVRLAVAVLLAFMHVLAFAKTGDDRIDVGFNTAAGHEPYYSDPDASAVRGYPRQPHYWSRLVVSRWDAQHYIGFAIRGITACPTDGSGGEEKDAAYLECGLGWLPAWGLAAGAITEVLPAPADYVLMILSLLAAVAIGFLWTSSAIVDRIGRVEAYATLVAFHLFPSAFYIVTPYSEAATLALVLAGFVCLAKDRWLLAGLAIGAASALRASVVAFALALGCAALYRAWTRRNEDDPRWWRPLLAIPLSGWGMVAQLIALQIFVGDWRAYLRARDAFGDQRDFTRILDPEWYLRGFTAQHLDGLVLVGTLAIIALMARRVLKRFTREEAIFLAVSTVLVYLISIGSLQQYWGLNRYLLLAPLFFLCAGSLVRRHPAVFVLWCVLCAAMYWHVELCSYIAQGHGGTCPCLGRTEFVMPYGS